jgi:hypothetical protein
MKMITILSEFMIKFRLLKNISASNWPQIKITDISYLVKPKRIEAFQECEHFSIIASLLWYYLAFPSTFRFKTVMMTAIIWAKMNNLPHVIWIFHPPQQTITARIAYSNVSSVGLALKMTHMDSLLIHKTVHVIQVKLFILL